LALNRRCWRYLASQDPEETGIPYHLKLYQGEAGALTLAVVEVMRDEVIEARFAKELDEWEEDYSRDFINITEEMRESWRQAFWEKNERRNTLVRSLAQRLSDIS